MNKKSGTIVSSIWLLPSIRRKGLKNLEHHRTASFKDYQDSPLYGHYGGHPSHWNFGLLCLSKIAKESNCDLILYTDPYTEKILKSPIHQEIINCHPSLYTKNVQTEMSYAFDNIIIRHHDLNCSKAILIENTIQSIFDQSEEPLPCLREFIVPYYNVAILEKILVALDSANKCKTDHIYWIDTHMWYSNNNGGLSSRNIDEILNETATGEYFNLLHKSMKQKPKKCFFVDSCGLTIAGGVFGGTKEAVCNALSVYLEEFDSHVKESAFLLKNNNFINFPNLHLLSEQSLLKKLIDQNKINNYFIVKDPKCWDIHLWPKLLEKSMNEQE